MAPSSHQHSSMISGVIVEPHIDASQARRTKQLSKERFVDAFRHALVELKKKNRWSTNSKDFWWSLELLPAWAELFFDRTSWGRSLHTALYLLPTTWQDHATARWQSSFIVSTPTSTVLPGFVVHFSPKIINSRQLCGHAPTSYTKLARELILCFVGTSDATYILSQTCDSTKASVQLLGILTQCCSR